MAHKKNADLIFKTKKERSAGQLKKFALALLCFVVVFGSLSVLYFFKSYNFNLDSALGKSEPSSTAPASSVRSVTEKKCTDFLFFSASPDKKRLNFVYVVRTLLPECRVIICPLPLNTPCAPQGEWRTLQELYAEGGTAALTSGVNMVCQLTVSRSVMSTDETFKQAVNYLGGFTVTVSDHVEYRGDFNLILVKGNQSLKGDSILKYLRYLGMLENDAGVPAQALVLRDILSSVLNENYSEKKNSVFSKLSNILTTDVSIVDFSAAGSSLELLMQPGKTQYVCVASPDELLEATRK